VLSESDEEWLDGEGNLIDEERVLELLENSSNYERGIQKIGVLSSHASHQRLH
jgi:hypothetical protein